MIFQKMTCGHYQILDFGATETAKNYGGDEATKRLIEGFIKLPKCLKDMLGNLAMKGQRTSDIEAVGFIHSGFNLSL